MHNRVLVTGASSGIGFATAQIFAERGWEVIACSRNGTGHPAHPSIRGMAMDVGVTSSVDECFGTLHREGITMNAIVNNAGWGLRLPFAAMNEKDIAGMFETNVFGAMRVTRAWLASPQSENGGVVINIGSLAGHMGMLYHAAYCASKHALKGWSEALSYELQPRGIAVKIVDPLHLVATQFTEKALLQELECSVPNEYIKNYHAYARLLSEAPALLTPLNIAEEIWKAATDGKKKVYYPVTVGFSIRAALFLHCVLPSLAIRLMAKKYRTMLG